MCWFPLSLSLCSQHRSWLVSRGCVGSGWSSGPRGLSQTQQEMEPLKIEWIGSPCGTHGPYTFYKAFSLTRGSADAKIKSLSVRLGHFFFVRCQPHEPESIAELQLLWEDRGRQQLLASVRLYCSPEHTPQGRKLLHGQDEVIAVSKKIIIRLQDLAKWLCAEPAHWAANVDTVKDNTRDMNSRWGGGPEHICRPASRCNRNTKEPQHECKNPGVKDERLRVKVLSYPQYCRYRAMQKRIQKAPTECVSEQHLLALGGILSSNQNIRILYCRETFEHPTLADNKCVCDELAALHKGRSRKKKARGVGSDERASRENRQPSQSDTTQEQKVKVESESMAHGPAQTNQLVDASKLLSEEQRFLNALHNFMRDRNTPISRIPHLGFKKIDLFIMFTVTQRLGGYEAVTARRLWKHIYDELGGNPGSTSAATCTRRHYERLILPYERYLKGEEDKPLPPAKARKHTTSMSEDSEKEVKIRNGELHVKVRKAEKEGHLENVEGSQVKHQKKVPAVQVDARRHPDRQVQHLKCEKPEGGSSAVREHSRIKSWPPMDQEKGEKIEAEKLRSREQTKRGGETQESHKSSLDLASDSSVKPSLHVVGGKIDLRPSVPMFQHLQSGILNFQLPRGVSPLDVLKSRLGLSTSKDASRPTLHRAHKVERLNSQVLKLCCKTLGESERANVATGLTTAGPEGALRPGKKLVFRQVNGIQLVNQNASPLSLLCNTGSLEHIENLKEENKASPRPELFKSLAVNAANGMSLTQPRKRDLKSECLNLSKASDSSYIYDHKGTLCEILPQNLSNKQSPLPSVSSVHYREQSSPLNLSKSSRASSVKRTRDFMDTPLYLSKKTAPSYLLPSPLKAHCKDKESHEKDEQSVKKLKLDSHCNEATDQSGDSQHLDPSSVVEGLSEPPPSQGSTITMDDLPTDLSLPRYPKIQKPSETSTGSDSSQEKKMRLSYETAGKDPPDPPQISSLPGASKTVTETTTAANSQRSSAENGLLGLIIVDQMKESCPEDLQKSPECQPLPSGNTKSAEQSHLPHSDKSRKDTEESSGKKSLASQLNKVSQEGTPERDSESNLSNQASSSTSQGDNRKGPASSPYLLGGYHPALVPQLQNMAERFGAHFQLVDLNKNSVKPRKSDSVLSPGLPNSPVMVPGSVQHRQLLASHSQQMYNHLLRAAVLPGLPYDELLMHRLSSSPSAFSPSHLSAVYPEKQL
ncbi:AT-rich interactive domain-containing protein 5B-like isoform X2 [Callorhinchus milii]|uniref:AT-rich interactive domain-containing protein 5B-like isoform X2 n=1 Tax=Callorhinchus milii TaxID=7868 RepID=UPI001C3F799D|nr:AT-rich interactive domain-containing protein 5B-like isoform X2 [Callorhinchus milii]